MTPEGLGLIWFKKIIIKIIITKKSVRKYLAQNKGPKVIYIFGFGIVSVWKF